MPLPPLVLLLLLVPGPTRAQELARNGGMEEGAPGAPPTGWVHNAYGELAASTERDTGVFHSGAASLRLECDVFRGGAAQAYLPVPAVRQGETYTLSAWMRAESLGAPVRLFIRDLSPPYHVYLETTALVTEAWRPVVATGPANADGASVGVYVNFQSAGKLWVDDVSFQVGEHPIEALAEALPVVKGNRVQNSGFELGMAGWTIPEMVAIEDGGVSGKCAHWLNTSGYMLEGRPVTLTPGQSYTFSASLRSPEPGTRVRMSLHEVGGNDAPGQDFALTDVWQRYAFPFVAQPQANPRYFLSFAKVQGGGFLVDEVQLEEGDLTDYAPAQPLEVAFDLPRAQRFPAVGERITVPVIVARSEGAEPTLVTLTATDYFGRRVAETSLPTDGPRAEASLSFDAPGFVSLALGGPDDPLDEAQLCVVAPMPDGIGDDRFFGCHGTEGTPGEYHALTAMAKAGARFWRLHDMPSYTQWYMVEPEKGRWVWYDEAIDAMRERGMEVFGVFCRTPEWAGRDPGGERVNSTAWPPRDWDEYGEYVYRTVEHYRDQIHCWEAWNEPWGRGFWAGTPEEYGKLLEVTHAQAKRADPGCTIVGGCFWPPEPEFTDRVLATGALSLMDAVSYHHYCEPDAVAMGQVKDWYEHMRGKIDAAGGKELPLWMTEGGTACPSFYAWLGRRDQARAAAETVAKHLIQTKALGVETFFYYYAWQEIGSPRMFHGLASGWYVHPLLEYDGSPKTSYAAYSGAAHLLTGAKPVGQIEEGRFRIYAFQRGDDAVLALWARDALVEPARLSVDVGNAVRQYDLMGAEQPVRREAGQCVLELDSAPTYLIARNVDADTALRRIEAAVR